MSSTVQDLDIPQATMSPETETVFPAEILLMIADFADVRTLAKLVKVNHQCYGLITPVLYRTAVEDDKFPLLHWAITFGKRDTMVSR